jgi:dTMP kinase
VGLPRPDLCLFLDISAEDAAERGGYGTEKYEKKEMQDRVRELFVEMMQHMEERDVIVKIDAGKSVEDVALKIDEVVEEMMQRVDDSDERMKTVSPW